jgi:hypothetical protein
MPIPANTGTLDQTLGIVLPNNLGTWGDLAGTTWEDYKDWANEPANPMIYVSETIAVPFTEPYTLKIITTANGIVSYDVLTSNTGAFAGEETTTTIANGATTVPSFQGTYVVVVAKVAKTSGVNSLENMDIRASNFAIDVPFSVDTSTLAGSAGSRILELPRPLSGISNMTLTVKTVTAYTPNVYVTDISTTQFATAIIVSKSVSEPRIGVFGIDGYARDAVVDVVIKALPQQKMVGNNLVSS